MTDPLQLARDALRDLLSPYKGRVVPHDGWFCQPAHSDDVSDARAALAALDAAIAQRGEPVAWLCELFEEDGSVKTQIVEQNPAGLNFNDAGEPSPFRVTPLYTSPPARVPLTDEQLWNSDEIMSLNADLGWSMETIRMFARAIERAHGITGA